MKSSGGASRRAESSGGSASEEDGGGKWEKVAKKSSRAKPGGGKFGGASSGEAAASVQQHQSRPLKSNARPSAPLPATRRSRWELKRNKSRSETSLYLSRQQQLQSSAPNSLHPSLSNTTLASPASSSNTLIDNSPRHDPSASASNTPTPTLTPSKPADGSDITVLETSYRNEDRRHSQGDTSAAGQLRLTRIDETQLEGGALSPQPPMTEAAADTGDTDTESISELLAAAELGEEAENAGSAAAIAKRDSSVSESAEQNASLANADGMSLCSAAESELAEIERELAGCIDTEEALSEAMKQMQQCAADTDTEGAPSPRTGTPCKSRARASDSPDADARDAHHLPASEPSSAPSTAPSTAPPSRPVSMEVPSLSREASFLKETAVQVILVHVHVLSSREPTNETSRIRKNQLRILDCVLLRYLIFSRIL